MHTMPGQSKEVDIRQPSRAPPGYVGARRLPGHALVQGYLRSATVGLNASPGHLLYSEPGQTSPFASALE
jgi:hypothetical protein